MKKKNNKKARKMFKKFVIFYELNVFVFVMAMLEGIASGMPNTVLRLFIVTVLGISVGVLHKKAFPNDRFFY